MTTHTSSSADLKANCSDILHIISQILMGRWPWHLLSKLVLPTGRTLSILTRHHTEVIFSLCTQYRDSRREMVGQKNLYYICTVFLLQAPKSNLNCSAEWFPYFFLKLHHWFSNYWPLTGQTVEIWQMTIKDTLTPLIWFDMSAALLQRFSVGRKVRRTPV